ncbi:hypothetical protein H2199_002600 [Coniosporium tulheliwenetii]|uniref:Uncharacterized protein n=1 Tax=Coniosporium tulheliwenetii TaxID=3383036 RepID=A0ACC2ZGY8_9PEZI|nr:hypothetical protein H2199_002600 [Cladosporium sp. JES 115]
MTLSLLVRIVDAISPVLLRFFHLGVWVVPALFYTVLLARWYFVLFSRQYHDSCAEDDPSTQPRRSLAPLCLNICCLSINLVLNVFAKNIDFTKSEIEVSVLCTIYECYLAAGKHPFTAATKSRIAGWLAVLLACFALYKATFTIPDGETLRSPKRGGVVREQIRQIGMVMLYHVARRKAAWWRAMAERYEARAAGRGGE